MGLTQLLNNPFQRNLFAIDKYWFILQSVHNWYLIIPPTVVQQEGYSDIEKRVTNFEKHMQDLDKTAFMNSMAMRKMRL